VCESVRRFHRRFKRTRDLPWLLAHVCSPHFLKDKDIIVCHDLAYADFTFDGLRAPSFLEVPRARDFTVEFHTLSKSYSLAGWRIGFAVGNSSLIDILKKTKSYVDFGIFPAVQRAAVTALRDCDDYVVEIVGIYQKRRNLFIDVMAKAGWKIPLPKATFYVWAPIPLRYSALPSLEFCKTLLRETGVACAPGTGFGEHGEGYVRFALVQNEETINEAGRRIKQFLSQSD